MRLSVLIVGLVFILGSSAAAQRADKYVSPKKDGVGIYKNEVRKLYEEPISKVGTEARLLVVKEGRNAYQVEFEGDKGWVDKQSVVAVGKSKTFVFDNADVIGYLDNPTPVYIIDADDPNANPITLDRSFKDALRENVDRETVERMTD
ncbi:MAG: hypothetical protein GF331_09100 [Chitinivibrionales bacterium]|nr:hypothetical protein [Chitinivibrionales bacterium]